MRGKGTEHRQNYRQNRITPAYAGKSIKIFRGLSNQKDHPRLCGEKRYCTQINPRHLGSPPPMRGKVDIDSPDFSRSKDHPRLCGEKQKLYLSVILIIGSPPPMRGKVLRMPEKSPQKRITPAYAGKRIDGKELVGDTTDHPRLCGEKSIHQTPA